jgi:hypothetical protein
MESGFETVKRIFEEFEQARWKLRSAVAHIRNNVSKFSGEELECMAMDGIIAYEDIPEGLRTEFVRSQLLKRDAGMVHVPEGARAGPHSTVYAVRDRAPEKKTKVVINKCFGGFSLSREAILELDRLGCPHVKRVPLSQFAQFKMAKGSMEEAKRLAEELFGFPVVGDEVIEQSHRGRERACPVLVEVVERLGDRANTKYSELKVVEVPADVEWEIEEYDGVEAVEEKHRSWG